MEKPVQQPADTAQTGWENEGGSAAPEQETATGHVIPVPTKDRVMSFFKKVTKPTKG
jgi:hypothetical protein